MTKRHYLQSLGIFIATAFFVRNVFGIHWFEVICLLILTIVCVVHTMDMRDEFERRKYRKIEKERNNGETPGPTPL